MTQEQKNNELSPFTRVDDYESEASAQFHPDTLFITFPARFSRTLKEATPDAIRSFYTEPDELWFQGRLEHERLHWMQTVGSSFGFFLALLRQRAALFATLFWDDLTNEEIATICKKHEQERVPPLSCDARGALHVDASRRPVSNACASLCWKTALLSGTLKHASSPMLMSFDFSAMAAYAMALLKEPINPTAMIRRELAGCSSTGNDFQWRGEDVALSAAALEEALAVSSQLSFVSHMPAFESPTENSTKVDLEGRARSLQERHLSDPSGLYVSAFKYFDKHCPGAVRGFESRLFAFGLAADLALNPVLPPFSPHVDETALCFEDILPSRRFIKLVSALSQLTWDHRDWAEVDAEIVHGQRVALASAAGIATWRIDEAQAELEQRQAKTWQQIPRVNAVPLQLLYRAANAAVSFRLALPQAYINPADTWLRQKWAPIFVRSEFDLAWMPPLIANGENGIANCITTKDYHDVLFSQLAIRTLMDTATKMAPISYVGFPSDPTFYDMKTQVSLWLQERYGGSFYR